jgi:hypothetical protein
MKKQQSLKLFESNEKKHNTNVGPMNLKGFKKKVYHVHSKEKVISTRNVEA